MNATHRQAVREGPHSNSVGSLLHNTVAYVTNHSRDHLKQVRCVPVVRVSARNTPFLFFFWWGGEVYLLLFLLVKQQNVLRPDSKQSLADFFCGADRHECFGANKQT